MLCLNEEVLSLYHQVLLDFAAERASVVAAATAQVEAAQGETQALRRLLQLKTRELKHIRRLGQEVLLQRSEVEIFLLSSIHQVGLAGMGLCDSSHQGRVMCCLVSSDLWHC